MNMALSRLAVVTGRAIHNAQLKPLFLNSSRACGWVRDWKPGPPVKTEEERIAAAAKYNLIPEDYEPDDEHDGALGDYPKLQKLGMDARDPYEDMDFYYMRRNYGETIHIFGDMFTADRFDPNEMTRLSGPILFFQFFGVIFAGLGIVFLVEYFDLNLFQNMKPKQYPGPGKVHYTFEPLD